MDVFQAKAVEKIKTHICVPQLFTKNEIMWKNTVQLGKPQTTMWSTRIACWITKATDRHSEYVIIIAFPLHQWLHEDVSVLRYSETAGLFICNMQIVWY